jgi:hypothetical protein
VRLRKRQLWTIVVVVAVAVLVVIIALIGLGYLVLPGTPAPAKITLEQVNFTIVQGTNRSGANWFGPSHFSYAGLQNGYPFKVASGGTFNISLVLENFDSADHSIYSVSAATPFVFHTSTPVLPAVVLGDTDSAVLQMTFSAPNSPGATLTLFVTVNALPPG